MKKPKEKAVKVQSPSVQTAAIATEQYKRTESGFVLVKTARNGSVTEIPLSNFSAEIITEVQREYEYPVGTMRRAVESLVVKAQFEDVKETIPLDASRFNDSLVDRVLKIHPRAVVYPGKDKHVIAAIKTLSNNIRIVVKGNEADSKTNNKQNNKE
jgi:hypothetical protein